MSEWLKLAKNVLSVLFGMRRSDIESGDIRHAPPLTGEPSGYVEPPLPPHEGWPGKPGDPDYIKPSEPPQ